MDQGFAATIRLLTTTKNEAAARTLVAGLDSSRREIREACLAAIVARRSPAAHREVLGRLHTFDEHVQEIVRRQPSRMAEALHAALSDDDAQVCANGCMAAVWFGEYDLIPALITLLEDPAHPRAELAGRTLLELAEQLYDELGSPRDDARRRDPQMIRSRVVGHLERSAARFGKHRRRQIVKAFVLLARRDNATLRQLLLDPRHSVFAVLMDSFAHSQSGGVMRLLISFLDDPHAPMAILHTTAKRGDATFIRHLLGKVGPEPTATVKQNLKRIKSIRWLAELPNVMDELDETEQQAVVPLAVHSGIPRTAALAAIGHVLGLSKPLGRRAAAEALAEFHGAEANRLALDALRDEDPEVQAAVVRQLRQRGIPDAMPRLLEMVDSPHATVRNAVRESLAEFSFPRFLATFDALDDAFRHSTGELVKRIDPDTVPLLEAELQSQVRTRRLRALDIARTIGVVNQLEEPIMRLLNDNDHVVRTEAALVLGETEAASSLSEVS